MGCKGKSHILFTKFISENYLIFFHLTARNDSKNFHFFKADGKDTTTILSNKFFIRILFTFVPHCQSLKELFSIKSGRKDRTVWVASKYILQPKATPFFQT
jgi:hypothetical protein